MPFIARYQRHRLELLRPAGTSRGYLEHKDTWLLHLQHRHQPQIWGCGEAAPLIGLSIDAHAGFENKIAEVCDHINDYLPQLHERLTDFPALRFALESALRDVQNGGRALYFPSPFTENRAGIAINGLIWMGDIPYLQTQIEEKLQQGYTCLKMKVGALRFADELEVLQKLRRRFPKEQLEIRVDANGAFSPCAAIYHLEQLAALDIHSIEQPIAPKNWRAMADLCRNSSLAVALDEELIGVSSPAEQQQLLDEIQPQYIVLKPTFLGGWAATEQWMRWAKERNIDWWVTSALEGNVGLNALAQWAFTLNNPLPQGLGTGQLYRNNFESPLYMSKARLWHRAPAT